jgi:hypothetical protein
VFPELCPRTGRKLVRLHPKLVPPFMKMFRKIARLR